MAATTTTTTSPLFILYGSATGNAEHIAKELAETYESLLQNPDADTYFSSVVCCELDQYKKKKCLSMWEEEPAGPGEGSKHGVLIVVSTTGNGDAPENASRFVRYIKRKTTVSSMPFKHCAYAVLGLGDTNYDQFCNCGKTVDKKLAELGGKRCLPIACADEATGLEDVVEPWTATIFQQITNACRGQQQQNVAKEISSSSSLATEEKKMDSTDVVSQEEPASSSSAQENTDSQGVQIVRSLLNLSSNAPIWEVDPRKLHSMTSSLSSCELVHDHADDENGVGEGQHRPRGMSLSDSVSTASSSGVHYTMKRPFESSMLEARYLTGTPVDAAKKVSDLFNCDELSTDDILLRAKEIYDESFPLTGAKSDVERNGKRVIELTLALPDDYTLEYAPGDSLGLIVENTPDAVQFVLSMFREQHGIAPDQKISIDSNHPVTVEEAVRKHIDLCSPIKNKRILYSLAQHAVNPDEACALLFLSSKTPEGSRLFQDYVDNQRLTVVDILREFPSCQSIPMEGLMGILPSIPPRYYSVSSSPVEHHRLSLTVAFSVVDYMTPSLITGDQEKGKRRVRGVATRLLETLCSPLLSGSDVDGTAVKHKLKIFPKPTTEFRMPGNLATALILIGPGTGIAPFMGFLSHRRALVMSSESTHAAHSVVEGTWRGGYELEEKELPVGKHDTSGLKLGVDYRTKEGVGSVDVFFGCRHRDHDWLYKEEMESLKDEGVISQLYVAFSRDGNRQYVQDIMQNDEDCSARIVDLILSKKACVYVCGDGNAMAKDVQGAIVELVSKRLEGGIDEAKDYLETMKAQHRFLMDIWS